MFKYIRKKIDIYNYNLPGDPGLPGVPKENVIQKY